MVSKILVVVLLGALSANAQSDGDFVQRILLANELSAKTVSLSAQKVAIEEEIFEANYKLSNLITVDEVLKAAASSNLPKNCKVDYDGSEFKIKNETGEVATFEVYGPQARADLVGLRTNPIVKATVTLDQDSYQRRNVLVYFDSAGKVVELYAEQYFQDHGTRMEYQARCWRN